MNRTTNRSGRSQHANSERRRNLVKQFSQYQRASSSSGEAVRLFGPQRDAVTYASQQARTLPERLDSWKEIASYLGREVRTAQRWEKQECLPVHRHFHQKTSSVYGFKTEIDEWRDNRSRSGALFAAQFGDQLLKRCNGNDPFSRWRDAVISLFKGRRVTAVAGCRRRVGR